MPSLIKKKGVLRYRASVIIPGKKDQRKQKLFPDSSTKSYREALAWEKKTQVQMQGDQALTGCIKLGKWADQYLNHVQARFVGRTYKEKKAVFKRLFQFKGIKPEMSLIELAESSGSDVSLAYEFLKAQFEKRSGNSANKDRKNLAAAWGWGIKYLVGFPKNLVNPFYVVEKFPEVRNPRYVPSEKDFWRVYNVAQGQDKVMLLTAFHLAARRGELFRLKKDDLDFENNNVRLWTRKRKGGNLESDWLPMTPAIRESLWKWCDYRFSKCSWDEENVFVCLTDSMVCEPYYGKAFTNRQHLMKRLCKRAGVKPFGFHAIRHLSATVLYHKGKELYYLQRFLRHKDPMTTQRYLHRLGLDSLRQGISDGFSNSEQGWTLERANDNPKTRTSDAPTLVSGSQGNVIIFPENKKSRQKFSGENTSFFQIGDGGVQGVRGCPNGVQTVKSRNEKM